MEVILIMALCDVWSLYHFSSQDILIPTMENGPEVAKRFYKELTDIQVSPLLCISADGGISRHASLVSLF